MWRSKKFIVVALLAAVVLAGSIGGVALARTGSGSPAGVLLTQNVSDNVSQPETLLARVAEKLGIDQQKLEDAVAQARTEMQEEALDNYLKNLVDQGKITQEQADQYKAWVQARPNIPLPGPFRGHGRFRGMGGFRGWAEPAGPPLPPTSQTQ